MKGQWKLRVSVKEEQGQPVGRILIRAKEARGGVAVVKKKRDQEWLPSAPRSLTRAMRWYDLYPGVVTYDVFADFKVSEVDGAITTAIQAGEACLLLEALEYDRTVGAFRERTNWAIPIIPPDRAK